MCLHTLALVQTELVVNSMSLVYFLLLFHNHVLPMDLSVDGYQVVLLHSYKNFKMHKTLLCVSL